MQEYCSDFYLSMAICKIVENNIVSGKKKLASVQPF